MNAPAPGRYELEETALRPITEPDRRHHINFATLGDLVVQALAGTDQLYTDGPEHPEAWESFERSIIEQTALQLKAMNHALASELTTDDHDSETFTVADACKMLKGIVFRLNASAELAHRMRQARWGHPNFGGGETWAERQQGSGAANAEGSDHG